MESSYFHKVLMLKSWYGSLDGIDFGDVSVNLNETLLFRNGITLGEKMKFDSILSNFLIVVIGLLLISGCETVQQVVLPDTQTEMDTTPLRVTNDLSKRLCWLCGVL